MVRVVLPPHLRNLAGVADEVQLDVSRRGDAARPCSTRSSGSIPVLRGTIRDQVSLQRRPFIRFFGCEEDLSHEPLDAPLPERVAEGAEPYLIIGAIAGG